MLQTKINTLRNSFMQYSMKWHPRAALRKIPFAFVTFSAIVLVVLMSFIAFNSSIHQNLNVTDKENISALASQEHAALNGIIKNTRSSLESITKTIVTLHPNREAQLEFLQNVEQSLNFDTIVMADIHGRAMSASGEKLDLRSSPLFIKAMQGEVSASDIQLSEITGRYVLSVAVPIRRAGRVMGTIIVEYGTRYMTDVLKAYTDPSEAAYVIDSNGFPVASSSDVYNSLNFLRDATFADEMTYEQFLDLVKQKKWGGTSFTLNGEQRIIEFRPLALNDWQLFLVSHDLLANPVRDISDEVQYVTGTMLVLFLLLSAYIIYLKRKTLREVTELAFYDDLTGLSNAVKFRQDVEAVIKKNPNMKYVMQKLDLENFKAINEMFDYETGNRVLVNIAKALQSLNDDSFLCARMRNDEFIMFSAHGFLDDNTTRTVFESNFTGLLTELRSYEFCFRYGRYFIQKGERDVADMMNKTTLAHSMTKSLGHVHTWDYDDAFRQEVRRSTELINMSKSAMQNHEFIVYFQPKYNLKMQKVTSGEALVRWVTDDGNMLLPDEFIPVFEQNGFVVEIDFFVLRTVCMRIKSWIEKGHQVLPISVNFSRVHLKNPHFVNELKKTCDAYGKIRQFIEVELTETAITENAEDLTKLLDDLREAGFTVAIDDFGAGYSSLGMLKDFKVDVLKLDKSFFEGSQSKTDDKEDIRGTVVVNGISAIAHDLGMKIIAEGIELSEHFTPLDANHLELAQGFFFAHPMPMDEFEQKYLD